jgi:hypothetical protein
MILMMHYPSAESCPGTTRQVCFFLKNHLVSTQSSLGRGGFAFGDEDHVDNFLGTKNDADLRIALVPYTMTFIIIFSFYKFSVLPL